MKKIQSRYLFDRCMLFILALAVLAVLLLVALAIYIAEEPWATWAVLGGAALLGGALYFGCLLYTSRCV